MEKGSTPEMPKHSARKVFRLSGAFATRFAAGGDFRYNSYASFAAEAAKSAPLAQLDRASGYEPEGREFESLRAHHSFLALAEKFPTSLLDAPGATGSLAATVGTWKPTPACSAVTLRKSVSSFTLTS